MGFRTSVKANGFAGAGRASTYQKGQSHRRTEEHGDLNTYNRVFQFYNYHADKDVLLDEMCRGLVLSVLRIAGGTVQEYDEPIAWPSPLFPDRRDHVHHSALVFHFKDNRRFSTSFGKTLSSFSGRSMTSAPGVAPVTTSHLPEQYDAEVYVGSLSGIPATFVPLHDGTKMFSLKELAASLADMFKSWIDFTQDITSVDDTTSIKKGIDLLPCRMQLIKSTTHHLPTDGALLLNPHAAHEVEYDDIEFGDSKVDVSAYTSVKLHNVTPASGNVLLSSDPMGSDNITHVPLKGKMYVFSGPTPKVWDKHRSELQHLFKPEFFRGGRYLLPNSKLHSTQTEEFRTPPRGRFIWSNCVDEHKITMAPGGMQELKLNYQVKTSIRDFWYKYRDDDLSSSKLGRSICVCLEPSMRRMHINTPIPVVLVKDQHVPIGGSSQNYGPDIRRIPVEYQPYEWVRDATTNVTSKQIRQVVTLGAVQTPTALYVVPATVPPTLYNPPQYAHPGVVGTIPWYKKTLAGVVIATKVPESGVTTELMWDEITGNMIKVYPELQSFVSRGDPLMFNVQINRNYAANCLLRNSVRLGADKSGVKRKYHEKMVSNMGDVDRDGDVDEFDIVEAKARGDIFADHELETATGAGVRRLVLEGDPENTALPMAPVTLTIDTDAALGAAVGNAVASAMDTDGNATNGVQLDISQLDSILDGSTTLQVHETSTALVNAMLAGTAATLTGTTATGALTLATNSLKNTAATGVTAMGSLNTTMGNAVVSADAGVVAVDAATAQALLATTALTAVAVNTGLNTTAQVANTVVVGLNTAEIASKSFAPTNNTYNNNTTQTVSVGNVGIGSISATAKATIVSAVTSALNDATGIDVDVGNHPTHPTSMSVTETNPLTTIATTGHPTPAAHPTSIDVNIVEVAGTQLNTAAVPISGASGGLAAGDAAAIATAIGGTTLQVAQKGRGIIHWSTGAGTSTTNYDIIESNGVNTGFNQRVYSVHLQRLLTTDDRYDFLGAEVVWNSASPAWEVLRPPVAPSAAQDVGVISRFAGSFTFDIVDPNNSRPVVTSTVFAPSGTLNASPSNVAGAYVISGEMWTGVEVVRDSVNSRWWIKQGYNRN